MSDVRPPAPKSLTIYIIREPFSDFFVLAIPKPDGSTHTEELDTNDTFDWFKAHGADMILLEKALDHIWNFARGNFEITNYKEPVVNPHDLAPILD